MINREMINKYKYKDILYNFFNKQIIYNNKNHLNHLDYLQ